MGSIWLWVGFNLAVVFLLALDLGVFNRRPHAIALGEAAVWSALWVTLSLAFNWGVLHWYGRELGLQFFTGYLIEKSLSLDNLFVFLLLFKYFGVEPRYQHRVLFWGILGALIMRGALIGVGVALIERFAWVLYLFGAFVLYAGAKMMLHRGEEVHPERNRILRWARKILPITEGYHGQKMFVREEGIWRATPLFLVLLVIETSDLAFALDSIPAIFAITRDAFIVYSSNVCAILGLRALYFLLAGVLPYLRYLDTGLSVILMFIGAKMLAEPWVHISTPISLAIVAVVLVIVVIASVAATRAEHRARREGKGGGPPHAEARLEITTHPPGFWIRQLAEEDPKARGEAAELFWRLGVFLVRPVLDHWGTDKDFAALLFPTVYARAGHPTATELPRTTVGVAVHPENFAKIRAANSSPRLARVPPDQDAEEFELHFPDHVRLDILTTREPGGNGAIARFLEKFGEGIQQIEIDVSDVDRATQILRERFGQRPIYPETRAGADGTRVNFFLAASGEGKKVLIELVEAAQKK